MRFLIFFLLLGCAPKNERQFDDDYVLIEFASKLEEESLKKESTDGRAYDPHKNVTEDKNKKE